MPIRYPNGDFEYRVTYKNLEVRSGIQLKIHISELLAGIVFKAMRFVEVTNG